MAIVFLNIKHVKFISPIGCHIDDLNMLNYARHPFWILVLVMTMSSNGNVFRVTGPLYKKFSGHRWILLTKATDRNFDGSFIYAWTNGWANNWELMFLRCHHAHYDITVMDAFSERSWYQSTSPKLTVRPCWGTFCVRGCHVDYIKTSFWKIVIFNAYLRNNIMLSTPSSLIDSSQESYLGDNLSWKVVNTGLILGLCPANERRRYFVTTSLFGWAQP